MFIWLLVLSEGVSCGKAEKVILTLNRINSLVKIFKNCFENSKGVYILLVYSSAKFLHGPPANNSQD